MNQSQASRETVAERAYLLWEQAGKPSGRDEEFWLRAEAELTSAPAAPPVIAPPIVTPLTTATVAPLHEVPPPIKDAVKIAETHPPRSRKPKRI